MEPSCGPGIVLALAFLTLQGHEYSRKEFFLDTNAYGSLFYVITGTHGAHVVLGTLMMGWVLARSLISSTVQGGRNALSNIGVYWHFVGVVWIVIFSVLYIGVRWL